MKFFLKAFVLVLCASPAVAQSNASTLEGYMRQEKNAWALAYAHYGAECLKDLDGGELVPPGMAVDTMNCYIRKINEYVMPSSLTKDEVNVLIDAWFQNALDHQNGVIDGESSEKKSVIHWEEYVQSRDKKLKEIFK